jgi:hypothetical protein
VNGKGVDVKKAAPRLDGTRAMSGGRIEGMVATEGEGFAEAKGVYGGRGYGHGGYGRYVFMLALHCCNP